MTDREKALQKIKKCLRLAKSSNEHEAATALRQARLLMQSLNISDDEVAASEASESRCKAGASAKPVSWEAFLADLVADVLGCELVFMSQSPIDRVFDGAKPGQWCFIGCDSAAEIATHAFTVLYRRLKVARADYILKALSRCGPASKRRRADHFCMGWVYAVRSKVEALAITERQAAAIKAFKSKYSTTELEPIHRGGKAREDDLIKGARAGNQVDMRSPISGGRAPAALKGL